MTDFEKLKARARKIPEVKAYLDSFSTQVGRQIFNARLKNNMSQGDLATRAGVTQATISRVEAGDPGIKGVTYNKIVSVLEIPRVELLPEEEEPEHAENENKNLVTV